MHVEVTDACNEKCRHCYNFHRDEKKRCTFISETQMDYIVDEFKKNEVLHVIVTGGEPLLALDKTIYLIKKAKENGMTVSLNSNLVSADLPTMTKLKEAGLRHVLTTLHSYKAEKHDYISNAPGSFDKIINGIKTTQEAGIRVTVNTILFQTNKDEIFEIGRLLKDIGVKKFLANRVIPGPTNSETYKKEFYVGREEIVKMFSDLRRVRDELGVEVGTCRSVPFCLFDVMDGNIEFMDRPHCVAGRRHMLVDINGDTAACVHESKRYGNVYDLGLKTCWDNMKDWRSLKYIPDECQRCHLFDVCDAGCRLVAECYSGKIDGCDNLMRDSSHLPDYYEAVSKGFINLLDNEIYPNPKLEYRKENGFYVFRAPDTKLYSNLTFGGANITFIDDKFGEAIIKSACSNKPLSKEELDLEDKHKIIYYIRKGLLVA